MNHDLHTYMSQLGSWLESEYTRIRKSAWPSRWVSLSFLIIPDEPLVKYSSRSITDLHRRVLNAKGVTVEAAAHRTR